MDIQIKRAYDAPDSDDGDRVLVDRIWPRGMSKEVLALTDWCKEVAPSTPLRKWFGHDPEKYDEFRLRYLAELEDDEHGGAVERLLDSLRRGRLTLVTATRDLEHSHVLVLAECLRSMPTDPLSS